MKEHGRLDGFLESQYSDQSPDAIVARLSFLFNAFVITKAGVIVGANDAFLQRLRCERSELYGRHTLEFVPASERDRLRKILTENSNQPYPLDVLSCDGSVRHTRVSPKLFYIHNELYRLAGFIDITETYIAELALRESEEMFKAIFSHGSAGIARIASDGRWLEVNQKLCEIQAYTETELYTLSFRDVTHPADFEEARCECIKLSEKVVRHPLRQFLEGAIVRV